MLRAFGMRRTLIAYPVMLGAVAVVAAARPDVWAMFYLQAPIHRLSPALPWALGLSPSPSPSP